MPRQPGSLSSDIVDTQRSLPEGLFPVDGPEGRIGESVLGNYERLLTFETVGLEPPTTVPHADDGAWEETRAAVVLAASVVVVAAVSATVALIRRRLPH